MNKDVFQASEEDRLRMMNLCAPRVPTPSDHFEEFANVFIAVILTKRIEQLEKALEANGIDVPEWSTFEEVMGNDG
jgi:hypothetical protein